MEITEQRVWGIGTMVGKDHVPGREMQGPQPDTELKHSVCTRQPGRAMN